MKFECSCKVSNSAREMEVVYVPVEGNRISKRLFRAIVPVGILEETTLAGF